MANNPKDANPTTMGKHGRLREEEALREQDADAYYRSMSTNRQSPKSSMPDHSKPDTAVETKAKVVEETRPKGGSLEPAHVKPTPESEATPKLNGPMLLSDVQAALSDKYPHNDIHTMEGATIEVNVPTGVILVDFKAVNKCKNTAELRAYIDSLPIL